MQSTQKGVHMHPYAKHAEGHRRSGDADAVREEVRFVEALRKLSEGDEVGEKK